MTGQPKPIDIRTPRKHPFEKWEAVRLDYVMGRGTIRWCALRHQMSYSTILNRAHKEQWAKQREQWFREKKMREMIPQVAALINPPTYQGDGPPPPIAPLSADFFLKHHNRYAQRLNSIDEELSDVFTQLREDREGDKRRLTIDERCQLMRVAKEYIDLTRTILGIPTVKPISREPGDAKPKRGTRALSIDIVPVPASRESFRTHDSHSPMDFSEPDPAHPLDHEPGSV